MTADSRRTIDLNADLGEHDGSGYASDEALLDAVSSANVACGAHAGSHEVMRRTVEAAMERGVSVGAHPSYPDREGFGRREIALPLETVTTSAGDQVETMRECCERVGTRLRYVKLHGALYNRSVRDSELAFSIAERIRDIDPRLVVLTLPNGAMRSAAQAVGLEVANEAFVDRAYLADGTLVPRDRDGAVLQDPHSLASRALRIAADGLVETIDGDTIRVDAASLCVHGDNRSALEIVSLVRRTLSEGGFAVTPFA